jgi:hypothetical protein
VVPFPEDVVISYLTVGKRQNSMSPQQFGNAQGVLLGYRLVPETDLAFPVDGDDGGGGLPVKFLAVEA